MNRALIPLLLVASVGALLLACFVGSTVMPLDRAVASILGGGDAGDRLVIWSIRFPRALCAFLVGCALGMSGAALQGLLRNPLAEPGVLGVSATASLAATFSLYYGLTAMSPWILPLAAILGAIMATVLLTYAALKTQSVVTLILVGVGLSSLAGALMSLLLNLAPNPFSLTDLINWTLGSVANRSFEDIQFAGPLMAIGMFTLYRYRLGLMALTLGEEGASAVGVNLPKQRMLIVAGAGIATGASVALAGAIGFVGIVAPHLIRPFVQHDPARSLVPSALLAGVLLVLADIGVRLAPTNSELALGVVAALLGAPMFIYIALQRRGFHG